MNHPYTVGANGIPAATAAATTEANARSGLGRTILIASISAVAGAFLIRLMDRTIFKDVSEAEAGTDEFRDAARRREAAAIAQSAQLVAPLPAPQALGPSRPPPGYVRIDVPKETMTDEFWARLAGEGGYE
jgi:hypothetical protein